MKLQHLIGNKTNHQLDDLEAELFTRNDLIPENTGIYSRARIYKELFTSKIYKTTSTNSYNVQINCVDNVVLYGSIRFFLYDENQLVCFVLDRYIVNHRNIFCYLETQTKINHIVPIQEDKELVLVKLKQIKSMFHVIRVCNYICKRPNRFKMMF